MAEDNQWNDVLYLGWLKAAKGLEYLQEGLEDFVGDGVRHHHTDLLKRVGVSDTNICNLCTIENVLPEHAGGKCTQEKDQHSCFCTKGKRNRRLCPNRICSKMYDCIVKDHCLKSPLWINTDPSRWCTDPWPIGKAYQSTVGTNNSAINTDASGLLSIIINNLTFASRLGHPIDPKHLQNNLYYKARAARNDILHSPKMKLDDAALFAYIDMFMDVLKDIHGLLNNEKPKKAYDSLQELKSVHVRINLEDESRLLELKKNALIAVTDIEKEKNEALSAIKAGLHELEARLHDIEKQMMQKSEKKEEGKTLFEVDVSGYEKLKQGMKEDLINFYSKYYSTIPVSPLVEEHDVPLTDFYVKPLLTSIDVRKKFGRCQEQRPIDSYKKLFFRSGDEKYKDIYITAKAGVGKTSFAKSICMTWCQAYRPSTKDKRIFNQEDVDVMKTFEFLFMISLRDIDSSVCDVDTMIEKILLTSLAGRSRYSRLVLEDVLNTRPCLVLLDGLDEWSHPTRCDRGCHDVHSTPPHTAARNKCTMMTTTRPWKFEALKLGRCQIDAHVDIGELDEPLSKQLISNAVSILNRESILDQPKTVEGFETVTTPLKLGSIRYIPYILMQMICLWFDGKAIGRSICEIYSNIIALTIARALLKLKKDSLPRRNLAKTDEIPSCIQSNDVCKANYDILIGLGELAFKRLFSSKRESNLVFQRSNVLKLISEDSLRFCFETGLLTQEKVYGATSEKRNNLSFHHKSIQEYLAALYIQSCLDKPDTAKRIRKVCVSLPDVLEMSNVCICLAGFSPDACMKMFHIFENTLVKDKTIEYFRNNLITGQAFIPKFQEYWAIMKSFQGLKIDIVQEIFNSGQRNIPVYIEDIIVDKTICETECKILMKVMANNKEKVKSLSISECRTTEEFTGKLKTLDMRDIRSLHKLMIDAVPHDQDLQQLLSGSVNTLTCLYLAFTIFNEQSEYSITQMSSATVKILSRMNNLQKIALEYINLKHPDIHLLFQYLSAKTTLTDIGLCNIECIDHDEKCNGESLDLSKNQELTELEIDRIPVSTFRVSLSSLEVCIIGKLQTDILSSFLPSLQEANRLRTLSFDSIPEKYTHMITETLEKIPKLETLSFQQCFRVDNVYLPPVMTSLEFVHLCDVYMTGCALEKLLESIDVLPQEVKMTLEAIVVIRKDENFAIPEDESNIVILAEEYLHIKEKIRSSSKYHVICDGQNNTGEDLFSFRTCK